MTRAPHAVIEVQLSDGVRTSHGVAAEQLPPKWFTKDPDSSFVDDLVALVDVITHAANTAEQLSGPDAFTIWQELDRQQRIWSDARGIPGLLSGLGTALVERALIDAVCRLAERPFIEALNGGLLGMRADAIHPELAGHRFAPTPASTLHIRHTVGLGDPLTDAEAGEGPDSLPVSLQSSIRHYGLTHLKIKTRGNVAEDIERLRRTLAISREAGVDPRYTIDGNESMTDAAQFQDWWAGLTNDPDLAASFAHNLIAVEQPFARSIALSAEVGRALTAISGIVSVIVDESDDDVTSVRQAMDLGYAGGTYKGCKGVFRGVANAALVDSRSTVGPTVFTAEDLATLPPLTVPQDIVVAAALGMTHIERNGHHYFGRLADVAPDVERSALSAHPDLFEDTNGSVRLRIRDGQLSTQSALAAPFGFRPLLDVTELPLLDHPTAATGLI